MDNDYSNQPLTGRYDRKQITPTSEALMLPVVTEESITKKANVINDATKSGKQKAAMVCRPVGGTLEVVIATGSKEDADWLSVKMDGVGLITPA
ncbi:hypothetical protein CrRp3_cds18 [Citrobacter phage vB_CroP_CrRp3]|uniref:Uncharacterized protein n=1 Tax=Citrobacter phage vB_CroP_CrRp3 TaxID=2079275 RepID=A0A2K9VAV6_9CAUD|nr:acetyl-CoA acetyltransferase [Citrobacter phage vB_CroP_CrRp3]AUV59360.1 hypothetical protein CrRp3_cds18 [Citrobacter phage vB_CroP_CrRp3]